MSEIKLKKKDAQNLGNKPNIHLSDNVKIEIIHAIRDIALELIGALLPVAKEQ